MITRVLPSFYFINTITSVDATPHDFIDTIPLRRNRVINLDHLGGNFFAPFGVWSPDNINDVVDGVIGRYQWNIGGLHIIEQIGGVSGNVTPPAKQWIWRYAVGKWIVVCHDVISNVVVKCSRCSRRSYLKCVNTVNALLSVYQIDCFLFRLTLDLAVSGELPATLNVTRH